MKKHILLFITTFIFAITICGAISAANNSSEIRICMDSGDQKHPTVFGDNVVWVDELNNNRNVFLYNIKSNSASQITHYYDAINLIDYQLGDPAIYGHNIIYELTIHEFQDVNGDGEIKWYYYICNYDILNGLEYRVDLYRQDGYTSRRFNWENVYTGGNSVFGSVIACMDDPSYDNRGISVYDFANDIETSLVTHPWAMSYPVIYGNRIVWTDHRNGESNLDIYMYDLSTGIERAICTAQGQQFNPEIYGDKVVWYDLRNYNNIYMYDLSTNKETWIDNGSNPKIYNNTIVYIGNYSGKIVLFSYNILTGIKTILKTFSGAPSIEDIDIHEDIVVWSDNRNGNYDCYMKRITPEIRDLGISLDYKKYVNNLPTYNADNIYGTDKFSIILKVTNNGSETAKNVKVNFTLPPEFKYVSSTPSGAYDDINGIWTINSLESGQTKNLYFSIQALKSVLTNLSANVSYPGDTNTSNNADSIDINIHRPVIFVHGFRGSSSNWNKFTSTFKEQGITYYSFTYKNTLDPYYVGTKLMPTWVNKVKSDNSYKGKFDIVCHSMGALVTRFYMAGNSFGNSKNIGQWIGIAPVMKGAAIADLIVKYSLAINIFNTVSPVTSLLSTYLALNSDAVKNLRTTDTETKALNAKGLPTNVIHRIIVGGAPLIKGVKTVEKVNGKYVLTTNGDGVVANSDSFISGPSLKSYYKYTNKNHLNILDSPTTVNKVISYLKNG